MPHTSRALKRLSMSKLKFNSNKIKFERTLCRESSELCSTPDKASDGVWQCWSEQHTPKPLVVSICTAFHRLLRPQSRKLRPFDEQIQLETKRNVTIKSDFQLRLWTATFNCELWQSLAGASQCLIGKSLRMISAPHGEFEVDLTLSENRRTSEHSILNSVLSGKVFSENAFSSFWNPEKLNTQDLSFAGLIAER